MFTIDSENTIQLTRGDTARFSVAIESDSEGGSYVMHEEDILRLTVKKSTKDDESRFQKVIKGSTSFHIEPADTKDLAFGKYIYDIELSTTAGDVFTIVGPATFEILAEVTF